MPTFHERWSIRKMRRSILHSSSFINITRPKDLPLPFNFCVLTWTIACLRRLLGHEEQNLWFKFHLSWWYTCTNSLVILGIGFFRTTKGFIRAFNWAHCPVRHVLGCSKITAGAVAHWIASVLWRSSSSQSLWTNGRRRFFPQRNLHLTHS